MTLLTLSDLALSFHYNSASIFKGGLYNIDNQPKSHMV